MSSTKEKPAAKKAKTTTTKTKATKKSKAKAEADVVEIAAPVAPALSNDILDFNGVDDADLTLEDELREMVMDARQLPIGQRRTVLLDLADQYPDSIWPFADLSGIMGRAKDNLEMAERGLANASKFEDKEFIEKHRGHFWQLRETQAYMRLLLHKARGLMDVRRLDAALDLLEKTLEL